MTAPPRRFTAANLALGAVIAAGAVLIVTTAVALMGQRSGAEQPLQWHVPGAPPPAEERRLLERSLLSLPVWRELAPGASLSVISATLDGDWAAVVLAPSGTAQAGEPLRALLHRQAGRWTLAAPGTTAACALLRQAPEQLVDWEYDGGCEAP